MLVAAGFIAYVVLYVQSMIGGVSVCHDPSGAEGYSWPLEENLEEFQS